MRVYGPLHFGKPAVLPLRHQPQVSPSSFCHRCMTHIAMVTAAKWLPGEAARASSTSSAEAPCSVESLKKMGFADTGGARIRVTSFTHPLVTVITRPRSLLWCSDYMQSRNYVDDLPWICKLGRQRQQGIKCCFFLLLAARARRPDS